MKNRLLVTLFVVCALGITLACNAVPKSWQDNPLFTDLPDSPPGDTAPGGSGASPNDPTQAGDLPVDPSNVLPGGPLKPVRFSNLGTVAFTISPWTYTAPGGVAVPAGPNPSTVAFPGGNTSNYLALPYGTYTWCYWWEIGDTNQDGIMEYSHALDERLVILDESSSDDREFAVQVSLAAPAETGWSYGLCGLDFTPFIVEKNHVDTVSGAYISLWHDYDSITLKGPITFIFWYVHGPKQMVIGMEGIETTVPETVIIPAGETWSFTLVDTREPHLGDWNAFLWLISVDE